MSAKSWEVVKISYCQHIKQYVALEALMVYPADFLPDPAPRVLAHRCSHGLHCNQENHLTCLWSGGIPIRDPFREFHK